MHSQIKTKEKVTLTHALSSLLLLFSVLSLVPFRNDYHHSSYHQQFTLFPASTISVIRNLHPSSPCSASLPGRRGSDLLPPSTDRSDWGLLPGPVERPAHLVPGGPVQRHAGRRPRLLQFTRGPQSLAAGPVHREGAVSHRARSLHVKDTTHTAIFTYIHIYI